MDLDLFMATQASKYIEEGGVMVGDGDGFHGGFAGFLVVDYSFVLVL